MSDDTGIVGRSLLALRADCANCFGLCCVALPFQRSADFAFDKAAAEPCRNLGNDFLCGIHARLGEAGMSGCSTFDCFGAGQVVSQHTFGGTSWRDAPATSDLMFETFPVVRALHELLWYLECAQALPAAAALVDDLARVFERVAELAQQAPDAVLAIDLDAERSAANRLLTLASQLARATAPAGADLPRIRGDLIGAQLAGADLRGAVLRGAYLIAADLSGTRLAFADVIGADLRGANVRGADLARTIYLTQFQVNSARGDTTTTLPPSIARPSHWR